MKNKSFAFVAITMIIGLGCAGPRTFINKETDWSFYKQLGVMPLVNLSADRYAGEKVQSALITELMLTERFQVVEPGDFNAKVAQILKAAGVPLGQELPLEQIKNIGEKTGVQGIIEGSVREYSTIRVGQADYPLISLNVRMIDVPSGNVVWMTSYTRKGGPKLPIISVGETHTLGELTQKICHDIISDLVARAF